MYSFATLFQTGITSDAYQLADIVDLLVASENASTAQYPLNPKKVDSILKSVIKTKQLLIAPLMAGLDGVDHTVSGRHRTAVADLICRNYGVNAKGAVVPWTDAAVLERINPEMYIDYCEVTSRAVLAALILAENGSRTMSGPEKASVTDYGGYATPGDKFKLRMSPILDNNLTLCDDAGKPIIVTAITLGQISGKLLSTVKTLAYATDEQLETVASNLNEYLNSDDVALPTKFAQYFASFIVEFLTSEIELTDEDGEPIDTLDSNGDVTSLTYAEHLRSLVVAPAKVAKAPSTRKVDAEKMAKMAALLLQNGIAF